MGKKEPVPLDVGKRLMPRQELADLIGVSFPTIWHWCHRGLLPRARVVGGIAYYDRGEIAEFMKETHDGKDLKQRNTLLPRPRRKEKRR